MIALEKLHSEDIEQMDYNQLISIVKETNRPPGGRESIFHIAQRAFLTKDSNVLEIGTSTGFTAIELAKLVKCSITAIDINDESLHEATQRARIEGVLQHIHFMKQDATNLIFHEGIFDLAFIGNVFSLLGNRQKTIQDIKRVLKQGGFIAAIPMYYIKTPSSDLLDCVSEAINVKIQPLDKAYWTTFFHNHNLELYWSLDFTFNRQEDARVDAFIHEILSRQHLSQLSESTAAALQRKYARHLHLFNENLSHMGFTIMLLRRKSIYDEDPELFTSSPR